MRTTLKIEDRLARAAKREAAERGVTLTSVVEEALRAYLTAAEDDFDFVLDLPVVEGELPPDVDIADREALYEILDRPARRR